MHIFCTTLLYFVRDSGRADVIRELENAIAAAEQLYHESGDLFKLIGLLRAFDVHWNKER